MKEFFTHNYNLDPDGDYLVFGGGVKNVLVAVYAEGDGNLSVGIGKSIHLFRDDVGPNSRPVNPDKPSHYHPVILKSFIMLEGDDAIWVKNENSVQVNVMIKMFAKD